MIEADEEVQHGRFTSRGGGVLGRLDDQGIRACEDAAQRRPSFEAPIDAFDHAGSYLNSLCGVPQIVTGLEKLKVFVDGDDACIVYDLKTAPVPTARTAEWYRVNDGKISSVTVVFDARPFAPLFEAQGH